MAITGSCRTQVARLQGDVRPAGQLGGGPSGDSCRNTHIGRYLVAGSTASVLDHHLQTFGAGDLPGLLADYSDQSLVILLNGAVLRGVDQIKNALFVGLFAEFAKPGASFNLSQKVIEGDIAYITWSAETADNVYEFATDTFVIRNGQIVVQTVGFKMTAKG
jgi:ketosteroid isomerase-like protein